MGGVQVKNHCVGLRPAPPLAEAKVTQLATASFRDEGRQGTDKTGEADTTTKGDT